MINFGGTYEVVLKKDFEEVLTIHRVMSVSLQFGKITFYKYEGEIVQWNLNDVQEFYKI
jgi:hypothetical protein